MEAQERPMSENNKIITYTGEKTEVKQAFDPVCDKCGNAIDYGFFLNGKLLCVICYKKETNRG